MKPHGPMRSLALLAFLAACATCAGDDASDATPSTETSSPTSIPARTQGTPSPVESPAPGPAIPQVSADEVIAAVANFGLACDARTATGDCPLVSPDSELGFACNGPGPSGIAEIAVRGDCQIHRGATGSFLYVVEYGGGSADRISHIRAQLQTSDDQGGVSDALLLLGALIQLIEPEYGQVFTDDALAWLRAAIGAGQDIPFEAGAGFGKAIGDVGFSLTLGGGTYSFEMFAAGLETGLPP
jgi:hypothetical protein